MVNSVCFVISRSRALYGTLHLFFYRYSYCSYCCTKSCRWISLQQIGSIKMIRVRTWRFWPFFGQSLCYFSSGSCESHRRNDTVSSSENTRFDCCIILRTRWPHRPDLSWMGTYWSNLCREWNLGTSFIANRFLRTQCVIALRSRSLSFFSC